MDSGRRMNRIIFSVFFLILSINISVGDIVPVFIWGRISESSNLPSQSAFGNLKTLDFEKNYVNQLIKDKAIVVAFVQDSLSSEDLSIYKEAYKNVKNPTLILPNVEDPVTALKNTNVQQSEINLGDGQEENSGDADSLKFDSKDRLIVVNLPATAGEADRFGALRKNDELIGKFLQRFNKNKNVVAIYTGIEPTWDSEIEDNEVHYRIARAAPTEAPSVANGTFLNYTTFFAYATKGSISFSSKTGKIDEKANITWPPTNPPETLPVVNNGSIKVEWDFANTGNFTNIKFVAVFNASASKFWSAPHATLSFNYPNVEPQSVVLKAPYSIGASKGFSFSCSEAIFSYKFVNETAEKDSRVHFKLARLQLQYLPKHPEKMRFAESFDCHTFFTVPIWMGLAIVILFTAILAMGIFMLFEVKTMDRFDDPKGKTISVPLTE